MADPQLLYPYGGYKTLAQGCNNASLKATSPCINRGISIANNGVKDYKGTALYYGGAADIGAIEYNGTVPPPPTPITTYYKIRNRYTGLYLNQYNNTGKLECTTVDTALWSMENHEGYTRFRNKASGYICTKKIN